MTKTENAKLQKAVEMIAFDKTFGASIFCGVDEAGRGPLAGPVAVCACAIPEDVPIIGINDSKKLSETMREKLYDKIAETADFCVVMIDERTIDGINILQATKLGMKRAIEGLKCKPSLAIIDAVSGLDVNVECKSVVKADAKSYAVAAASIMAKVSRDRLMREYDKMYPQYGFAKHKGYGTAEHIKAIREYGPCPIHRRTFITNFLTDGKQVTDINGL